MRQTEIKEYRRKAYKPVPDGYDPALDGLWGNDILTPVFRDQVLDGPCCA
jgi:hypothetical protein